MQADHTVRCSPSRVANAQPTFCSCEVLRDQPCDERASASETAPQYSHQSVYFALADINCHGIRSGDGLGVQTRLRDSESYRDVDVLSTYGAGQRSFLKAVLIQPCTLVGKIVAGGCCCTPIEIYRVNATLKPIPHSPSCTRPCPEFTVNDSQCPRSPQKSEKRQDSGAGRRHHPGLGRTCDSNRNHPLGLAAPRTTALIHPPLAVALFRRGRRSLGCLPPPGVCSRAAVR